MKEKMNIPKFLKNRNNLIVMVLAGILLMVIAIPAGDSKSGKETEKNSAWYQNENARCDETSQEEDTEWNESAYIREMEERVETILSKMEGAGEVHVIITLRSTAEKIVEKDRPVDRTQTNKQDSQGGSRIINDMNAGESTVLRKDGSVEEPYVTKTISPDVEGVVVMAQGADNAQIRKELSEAVQVLFGVEAHRVKVLKCR